MPRSPRIEYAGALYHVTSRGNRRARIYEDDRDRERFLETLGEACEKTGWWVHAYALMPNHYHLLLQTPEPNLSRGMQWLQSTYSARYRARHGLAGHLLGGRYKAPLIDPDDERYLRAVSSYIHLNPVRAAGLLGPQERLGAYRWSSFPAYRKGVGRRPSWLRVGLVLGGHGWEDTLSGRRSYAGYLERLAADVRGQTVDEELSEDWRSLSRGWCFGSEDFREELLEKLAGLKGEVGNYSGEAIREHHEREAIRLLERGLNTLGLPPQDLPGLRKTDPRKQALAWLLRRHTTVSNPWVSRRLAMGHPVNVSQSVRRMETGTDPDLLRWKQKAASALKS